MVGSVRDMDGWDPRRDAHDNANFNTYPHGIGRDLHAQHQSGVVSNGDGRQVQIKRRDPAERKTTKLFVAGVPRRCTTTSLEEMFHKYGEVVEWSRSQDPAEPQLSRLWVTYGSFREANAAISALNELMIDGVHRLKVEIAISDEERARRRQEKLDAENFHASIGVPQPQERSSSASSGRVTPSSRAVRACIACGKAAGQQCGSCKEPYCSRVCQEDNWPSHRQACIEKRAPLRDSSASPVAVSPPSLPRLEIRRLKVGSTYTLSVSEVTDPGDFAVLYSSEGDLLYSNMETILEQRTPLWRQSPPMHSSMLPSEPSLSVTAGHSHGVLGFFEEQFSRAVVIESASAATDGVGPVLWFADYGNTAVTPFSDIRPLPVEFAELPARVVPCALAGVVPKNGAHRWPVEVREMFKQLLLKDLRITVNDIRNEPTLPRHMVNILTGGEDLATVLVDAGYADWIRPRENTHVSSQPVRANDASQIAVSQNSGPFQLSYASDAIKVGDVFAATIVYHAKPGRFFVWKVDDPTFDQFTAVCEDLNRCFAASKPDPNFRPAIGDWVAAWVVADGQWCRARVTALGETSAGSVFVRYLDYGEDAELNPAQLRPLSASLSALAALTTSLPALAIACALTPTIYPVGSGGWCPTTSAFVEEQFPAWGRVTVQVVDKTAEGTALVVVKREDGASMADLILSTERGSTEAPPDPSTLALPQQIRFLANAVPPFPVERLRSKEGFSASIPHLSDWRNIFVNPLTEENQRHMVLVHDEITKAWQGRTDASLTPSVGDFLLAPDVDGAFYRAEVEAIDASTSTASVRFLDFGNVNRVSFADCLSATPGLVGLHAFGFWAPLESSRYDLSGAVGAEASAAITSQPELLVRLSDTGGVVEILTPENRDLLETLQLPAIQPVPSVLMRADQLPDCPFVPLDAALPVPILITDVQSLQRMFVQCLTSEYAMASEALEVVMATTMQPVVGEITVGDLLAVPFSDGCLYRAEIISTQAHEISVHFVDYGNCIVAPRESALALPPNAAKIPPLAFPVSVNDDAYVIPDGSLDATAIAQLTVESPTFDIAIVSAPPESASPLSPSKRPSFCAVIKDAVKTLNVLDVLAAAGSVKPRVVQSPMQPGACAAVAAPPIATPAVASDVGPPKSTRYRASAVPPCPFVPDVGEAKKIIMTEVISLSHIYVQVVVPEFLDVLGVVEESIREMEARQPDAVEIGDLVLALFPEDGAYYRAEILESPEENVVVRFVDYGNLVTVARSQLRSPSEKLSQYPRLCFSVKVSSSNKYSVNSCNLDDSILSWMKNPAPSFDLSVVNARNQPSAGNSEPLPAKIVDVNGNSIVDFLGDAGYLKAKASPSDTAIATSTISTADIKAKPAVEASSSPPVLQELPFPASGSFILSHFDSPAHFYLQNEDCIVAAVQLQSTVDARVAESQSFAETGFRPDVDSLVLSQFEGVFYRARVLSTSENDIHLHFIDYGNEARAPTSAIYPSTVKIGNVPKLCFHCSAAEGEVSGLSSDDVTSLRSFFPDGCFFDVEKVRLLPDQRYLVAPVESRAEFEAILKKNADAVSPTRDPIIPTPDASCAATVSTTLPNISEMTQGHMSLVDGAAVGCDINEFITPLDFRLSPKQETNEMSALTQELAAHGPTSSPLLDTFAAAASPPTLSAGSVVVALWSEGWYRAALLRDVAEPKPETVVDVRFIDYGNCDQVALKDVRQIHPNQLKIPIQSLHCRLSGVCIPDGASDWAPETQVLLQEALVSEATISCRVRKFNAEANVFLVILLLNEVAFQKTLVDKRLAAKIGAAVSAAPAAVSVAPLTAIVSTSDEAPMTTSPAVTPAVINGVTNTVAAPPSEVAPISKPEVALAAATPAPRSVSVIPKNGDLAEEKTSPAPVLMVPRSLRTPPPNPNPVPASPRPDKTIAVTTLQIGSESEHVVLYVTSVRDIAIVMQAESGLPDYMSMEEIILGSQADLLANRGKFEHPDRQLQRGSAVLALFEGQLYRAVVTAPFEDQEPDKIGVWFADYGNSAYLPQSDLVDIPADLLKLPALSAPCSLHRVLRPHFETVRLLHDIVNAKVVVRCHELDGRGAVPKMVVSLNIDGCDLAVELRNKGMLELEGDGDDDEEEGLAAPIGSSAGAVVVDINNNVVAVNDAVSAASLPEYATTAPIAPVAAAAPVAPAAPAAPDESVAPVAQIAPSSSAAAVPPVAPVASSAAADDALTALIEENKGLKGQLAEVQKMYEASVKKIEEMTKKIDGLKALI